MSFFTDEELENQNNPLADSTAQLDDLEKEEPTASPDPKDSKQDDKSDDDRIPAKYRGKSIEEIIEMHKNAEAWAQRQAEEVGFARKMAEQAALALRQSEPGSPKATDVDPKDNDVEFFADPVSTVDRRIAEHPDVKAAKEAAIEARQRLALETVQKAVGDPAKYLSDPEFLQWAQENPFRINALRHANQNIDPYAAIEIFQTFDLHKGRKQEQQQQQRDQVRDKVNDDKRKAIVDAGSPGEKSAAKVYRRADLIRLQNTDPDRYERLMPEIMKAYAEGRVR